MPQADSPKKHIIEVGDVPGHKLRVYEVRNEYPQRDFALAGVAVKELVSDGVSDHVNGSGSFTAYNILTLVDGNKVFVRVTGATQSDSAGGNRSTSVENFVGGTGKFKGIHGQMRNTFRRAPGSNAVTVEVDGEYWRLARGAGSSSWDRALDAATWQRSSTTAKCSAAAPTRTSLRGTRGRS